MRDCYQDFSVNAFFVHAVAIGLQSSLSSQVQWLTDVLFKLFLLGSFKVFLGHVKQLSSSSLHYFNCCLVKFSFKENRFLGGQACLILHQNRLLGLAGVLNSVNLLTLFVSWLKQFPGRLKVLCNVLSLNCLDFRCESIYFCTWKAIFSTSRYLS